jgi:hypothetical protein
VSSMIKHGHRPQRKSRTHFKCYLVGLHITLFAMSLPDRYHVPERYFADEL